MPINILFVDDEPATVNLMKLLIELEQPAWTIHAAYNGETALAIAERTPLDLVLVDISMPDMNGVEVCRRLRQMPNTAQVPVVMLTAQDTPQWREQSKAAGATDFWVKPFKPATLVSAIAKLIENRQA